jgi:hypothetical protein
LSEVPVARRIAICATREDFGAMASQQPQGS